MKPSSFLLCLNTTFIHVYEANLVRLQIIHSSFNNASRGTKHLQFVFYINATHLHVYMKDIGLLTIIQLQTIFPTTCAISAYHH
jgi:hypothetical protein